MIHLRRIGKAQHLEGFSFFLCLRFLKMKNFLHKTPPLLKQNFIVDKAPVIIHLKFYISSSKLLFPLFYQCMPHLLANGPCGMGF